MIYLKNNTDPQSINIPYSVNSNAPVQKRVQKVKEFTVNQYGQSVIMPDSGYTSMEKVNLTAPVTGDTVIFRPQDFFDYRNTFYTSGTPWSALTVDAQQFGDEQYTGGYNYALNNIDVESVQLSVSANGEYDAVIGPGGAGYIKKVIVDVPSSGSTEPFFGKVAKIQNVYLDRLTMFLFNPNDCAYVDFIIGSLPSSASTDYTELFYCVSEGDSPRQFEDGEPFKIEIDAYYDYTSQVSFSGYAVVINIEIYDKNGVNIDGSSFPLYTPINIGDEIEIKLSYSNYNDFAVELINKTKGTRSGFVTEDAVNPDILPYVLFFFTEERPFVPSNGTVYLKSFYNGNNLILPRSDGKMWNVTENTEENIKWIDVNGNSGTTFQTLYEFEIQ